MLDFVSSHILSVIFVFGTVVIIHELGHFAVAKLLKIRVEAFAVGFGPTLFGFRKGRNRVQGLRHSSRRLRENDRRKPG